MYEVFDKTQYMATYAADKLSFWVNGVEVAYLSNKELVVTRVIVSDSIKLGDWNIAVNAADGMTIQKRIGNELDLSGNVTITADQISAVADKIDLSGNTSIKLTANQVNAVASQINLEGNKSITLIAGQETQNRLDNLQIGGRNLLLESATKHLTAYNEAKLTFTDGVEVPEWGATDAIRCTVKGGGSAGFATLGGVSVNPTSISGQEYVHSIFVRNNGINTIKITNNLYGVEDIKSGESRRVVFKDKGNGVAALSFNFRRAEAGAEVDITYWHPKIELGSMVTDWSPAPEDTVSDLDEINEISNKLRGQQAEAQKAIDRLATAITIDTEGAHFYKPGYRDHSEVRIDQDSVDILVGGNVNSSFIAGGLILGNYMLWHPAAAGGLAFNLM